MKMRGAKRVADLLAEHGGSLDVARQITATRHASELPVQMHELARRRPDYAALSALFERLGFGKLRRERWLQALTAQA